MERKSGGRDLNMLMINI